MYDHGNGTAKLHVWLSTGSSFKPWSIWWKETHEWYFDCARALDRVVAGDFNGDGKDDIAVMYDHGNGTAKLHVWLSTGSSFKPWSVWWEELHEGWFVAPNVSGRMVAGDFNGDGKDDIAVMYDHGGGTMKVHVWTSTGAKFNGWQIWSESSQYDANLTTGRLVAGDFDGDGRNDVAAMYDHGGGRQTIHILKSTGSAFNRWATWIDEQQFDAKLVTGRMVAGDYNGDGVSDIATMYDYDSDHVIFHMYLSSKTNFSHPWWNEVKKYDAKRTTGTKYYDDNYSAGFSLTKITSYPVTYNANSGTGAPPAQVKWRDTSLTLSNTKPTRSSYTFKGWATSASATSATYQPGASYTTNANLTLYAVWEANAPQTHGDANGDGIIDARDLQRLTQHINGWPVEISTGADANGDGIVDARDLQRLTQYINGWPVSLGP